MKSPQSANCFSAGSAEGDNVMIRTNGAFVAGYELRGILAYFATDSDRNQTKAMLERSSAAFPMSVCASSFATRSLSISAIFWTITFMSSARLNRK